MEAAWLGLIGVGIGSLTTLLASVLLPWVLEERRRRDAETAAAAADRTRVVLEAGAALLHLRHAEPGNRGPEMARVGVALNEVSVRLRADEQVVMDILILILAMIQEPRSGVANMIGEIMFALNAWLRGDIPTSELVSEVEQRANIDIAADRKSARPRPSV